MWSAVWGILLALLITGAILIIIFDNGNSGTKIAWLLVITVLPVVGLLLYIVFGIHYRHHWYFKLKHRETDGYFKDKSRTLGKLLTWDGSQTAIREEFQPLARLLTKATGLPPQSGNDLEVITDGLRKLELLIEDLRGARESIHIEYFHFGNDQTSRKIKDLLMKKAREGVQVRFLYENIANFPISSAYYKEMRKAGVEVVSFTPARGNLLNFVTRVNYRNHRKIVVIDGQVAYTGGMNINEKYFFKWRDTHLRITGNAVGSLQYIFMDSWLNSGGKLSLPPERYFPMLSGQAGHPSSTAGALPVMKGKTVQIVPDEPDSERQPIRMCYEHVLHNVRKYVWFQTPYLAPPEPVLDALKSASLAGADVRIMLPAVPDNPLLRATNRSFYDELLRAGVRIFLRKEFIHAKTFVADDCLSCIGTANMDCRSFDVNYEVNTLIYDGQTASVCREIFLNDMEGCTEVLAPQWERRPWYERLLEKVFRLFSDML